MFHLFYIIIICLVWSYAYATKLYADRMEKRNDELIAEISRLNKHVIRIHKKFMHLATEQVKTQSENDNTQK